jgi:hypothetical protein
MEMRINMKVKTNSMITGAQSTPLYLLRAEIPLSDYPMKASEKRVLKLFAWRL